MAANSGANVLRYSALFAGVGYGLYHQSTINARTEQHKIQAAHKEENDLVARAKAEWVKKTRPDPPTVAPGVISDPEDPRFDLEKYLTTTAEGAKQ